jgi:hypothetical protein
LVGSEVDLSFVDNGCIASPNTIGLLQECYGGVYVQEVDSFIKTNPKIASPVGKDF